MAFFEGQSAGDYAWREDDDDEQTTYGRPVNDSFLSLPPQPVMLSRSMETRKNDLLSPTTLSTPLPLQNSWCFWHDVFTPNQTFEQYAASLKNLCSFDTVQDFWKCFNNLPSVNKLNPKSSFHLMRRGVRPMWEDAANVDGGLWAMRVRKEDTEKVWRELVLAVIGEQFSNVLLADDDICGLTVSIRQADNIIQVWDTRAAHSTDAVLERVRNLLPDVHFQTPFYKAHKEHANFNKKKKKPQRGGRR